MSVYETITQRIVERLEAGTVPWRQPWGGEHRLPRNLKTDKVYRGVNLFLLATLGYESPYFLTFKQAKELGGSVRRGEHGVPVIYWNWVHKRGSVVGDASGSGPPESGDGDARWPLLRHYTVFNVAQTEGLELAVPLSPQAVAFEPIEACERVVREMSDPPRVVHDQLRTYYRPSADTVNVPAPDRFESPEAYYGVLFHELGHASGHERRLARKGITDEVMFGSHEYSREELVAEMTSAFLAGTTGIAPVTLDNAAAYLAGWLKALRGDSRLVVQAAAQAQKAADWILGRTGEAGTLKE